MKQLNSRDIQSIKTKNKIIESADKLFSEKDYDTVKIRDICKAAGVSIGGFYHYFDSKEDIINESYNAFDVETENIMKDKKFSSGCEEILFLINCQVRAISMNGFIFATCYFKNQLSNKEKYILSKERYFYKKLLEAVKTSIDNGEICYENDEKFTDLLLRVSRGNIYNWCLNEGSYDLQQQTEHDIKYILNCSKDVKL